MIIGSHRIQALGTHAGIVHLLDLSGTRIKSYKSHQASILDICVDETGEFIATASMDGQVIIISLSSRESYSFNLRRPIRTVALEPSFASRSSRAFVCGGLAGTLTLREKRSFFGAAHSESVLHTSEGAVWQVRWSPSSPLIAWAYDLGVKIYDTLNKSTVAFIDRPKDSPRPDLFPVSLVWQDKQTLLIAWADYIKVARIRIRETGYVVETTAEITQVFQLDSMVAGIMPHPVPISAPNSRPQSIISSSSSQNPSSHQPPLTSFLLVTYTPPQTALLDLDVLLTSDTDRTKQAKAPSERPELRIISRAGEELAADLLSVSGYQAWGCGDYKLVGPVNGDGEFAKTATNKSINLISSPSSSNWYIVLSPRDLILVRPRDELDHVAWLVERERYEEALEALESLERSVGGGKNLSEDQSVLSEIEIDGVKLTSVDVGSKLVESLVSQGEINLISFVRYLLITDSSGSFPKAAQFLPKICARDPKRWEHWIFVFAEKRHLQVCAIPSMFIILILTINLQSIIPYVPTTHPRLDRVVYEMIVAHFLAHDVQVCYIPYSVAFSDHL